jgi:hypothetical protein
MASGKPSIERLEQQMQMVVAALADLALEIHAWRPQDARRGAPSSRDGKDELLVLLLAELFSDNSVQVVDVMVRAARSAELRQHTRP